MAMTRSVGSFSFTINDKYSTYFEYNASPTWTVTTQAKLLNIKTNATYTNLYI